MYKVLWRFDQISRSYKVAKSWIQRKGRHTCRCTKHFNPGFVSFIEKKPIKFYGVFDHFSWTYEVAKFWTIKLYLDVRGVIHANEHTKYANSDLDVNFRYFCYIVGIYLLKVNNRNTKTRCEICSKLTIKISF